MRVPVLTLDSGAFFPFPWHGVRSKTGEISRVPVAPSCFRPRPGRVRRDEVLLPGRLHRSPTPPKTNLRDGIRSRMARANGKQHARSHHASPPNATFTVHRELWPVTGRVKRVGRFTQSSIGR